MCAALRKEHTSKLRWQKDGKKDERHTCSTLKNNH